MGTLASGSVDVGAPLSSPAVQPRRTDSDRLVMFLCALDVFGLSQARTVAGETFVRSATPCIDKFRRFMSERSCLLVMTRGLENNAWGVVSPDCCTRKPLNARGM